MLLEAAYKIIAIIFHGRLLPIEEILTMSHSVDFVQVEEPWTPYLQLG